MKKYIFFSLLLFQILFVSGKGLLGKFSSTFHPGDTLKYEFKWKWVFFIPSIKAGELSIKYVGMENFRDQFLDKEIQVLHFLAIAKSSGTLLKVAGITIRDEFDIYVKPQNFCTILFVQNIQEGKRRNLIIERFFSSRKKLLYRKFKIVDKKFYVAQRELFIKNYPPIIHDPASIFFFLPIFCKNNNNLKIPIDFNGKFRIFNVKFKEDGFKKTIFKESQKTWKITVKNVFGGIKKGHGRLSIYFVKTPVMIPIFLDIKVKYGKVRGYLKEFIRHKK